MFNTGVAINGLDITFDNVVSLMAPAKFDYTVSDYASFSEMKQDFENRGRIRVNVLHSDKTIFGSPSTNWQFRAWHDMCHIQENAGFDAAGERAAARLMVEQLWKLEGPSLQDKVRWSAIIDAEVNGQGKYYALHDGTFPDDQRAFVETYLRTEYGDALVDSFPKSIAEAAHIEY